MVDESPNPFFKTHYEFQDSLITGLADGWVDIIRPWFESDDFQRVFGFLRQEHEAGFSCAPSSARFLRALQFARPDQVKGVILGQDPYPTVGHATGLAFGMENGAGPLPRSLRNIFKEIASEYQLDPHELQHRGSDLVGWARQGVLLLNTVLSVRLGPEQAGSHRGKGWESLTDRILAGLNEQEQGICFLLWGKPAQEKKKWLLSPQHRVLECAHPSPLSASRGFFGCNHFRLANEFIEKQGWESVIDWTQIS